MLKINIESREEGKVLKVQEACWGENFADFKSRRKEKTRPIPAAHAKARCESMTEKHFFFVSQAR